MSSRRRLIKSYPVAGNGEANVLEVELYFNAGGMNYFTYREERRGYYLSVSPYKASHEGHLQSKMYSGFSGLKTLVQEVSRFGQKKFDALVVEDELLNGLVETVLAKNGLTIQQEKQAA